MKLTHPLHSTATILLEDFALVKDDVVSLYGRNGETGTERFKATRSGFALPCRLIVVERG